MASAVLASRNESSWGQSGGGFMGKLPYSNPHLYPNPNSIPKKKKLHELSAQINGRHADESPSVTQTASDDAYSFNQKQIESNNRFDFNHGGYISFNTGSYTRSELIQFKKRLVSDFERIRSLNDRIESGKFKPRSHGSSQLPIKSKKLSGNKRPTAIPSVSGNDSKRLCQTADNGIQNSNVNPNLMKMCRQALTKLMKHKNSWVFNKPVDAAAMGLHDYHQIIKRPMDLGTVKSNFAKNLYSSPVDFAADVRLTFNNAMLYNPKFDDVYVMAEQLLARFEELFRAINHKLQGDRKEKRNLDGELHGSSWNHHISTPEKVKKPKFKPNPNPNPNPNPAPPIANEPERMPPIRSGSSNPPPPNPPSAQSPVPSSPSPVKPLATRMSTAKQPKPKAKDLDKREMSMEEKQKLGIGLQSLPPEKMPQLVQIIRKRNEHLADESDEIELDIETLDKETLWELDRFVTNWKKMVSKNKRQALMVNNNDSATATATATSTSTATAEVNGLHVSEKTETFKKPKKGEAGEEDVDIGDEMPMNNFPPVEIEKDDGGHDHGHASSSSSSSGSSSSDSSSSSGSDSGSSSGSDSDANADDAQS